MAGLGNIGMSTGQDWANIGTGGGMGQVGAAYLANKLGLIDLNNPGQMKDINQNGVLGGIKNQFLSDQLKKQLKPEGSISPQDYDKAWGQGGEVIPPSAYNEQVVGLPHPDMGLGSAMDLDQGIDSFVALLV
jgi:hypothetical protein